jgi:hypothetical protein
MIRAMARAPNPPHRTLAPASRLDCRVSLDPRPQGSRGERGRRPMGEGGSWVSGAERLPGEEESLTTLAHIARGVTEKKWHEHLVWVKERCRGKRYYLLRERQHTTFEHGRLLPRGSTNSMNKAPTGPYLAKIGQAADKCWWCGSEASQTRKPLFRHCRWWKDQQAIMWRDIRKAADGKRTARSTPMAQIFGDKRYTATILEFVEATEVGMRGRCRREDSEDRGEGLETGARMRKD